MTGIPLLVKTNEWKQFRSIYLEKQKIFSEFFSAFFESPLSFEHFQQKDDRHSLSISEITDPERRA